MDNQPPGLGSWLMFATCALGVVSLFYPAFELATGLAVIGGGAVALRDIVQWIRRRFLVRTI